MQTYLQLSALSKVLQHHLLFVFSMHLMSDSSKHRTCQKKYSSEPRHSKMKCANRLTSSVYTLATHSAFSHWFLFAMHLDPELFMTPMFFVPDGTSI